MGGLLILFLVLGYIGIGLYVSLRLIGPWWGKVLGLLLVVLIPTADAMYGRTKLKQLCDAEGGLKVKKVIDGVQGFSEGNRRPTADWILKYKYQYVEGRDLDGRLVRIELDDGGVVEKKNFEPQSKYVLERIESRDGPYRREEYRIRDLETNESLATSTNVAFEGGWVERFIAHIYASEGFAGACLEGDKRIWPGDIVRQTLKAKQ